MTSMASTADQHPRDGRRIMDRNQFINEVRPGCHLAEKRERGPFKYYHHSLVELVQAMCVRVIHYAPVTDWPFVKIHRKLLSFAEMSFELGVYLICSNGYPQSQEEREVAIHRACSRLEEGQYMAAINNCEHFVTWALTGTPLSHQIADGTPITIFVADTIDACCNTTTMISSLTSAGITGLQCGEKTADDIIRKFSETTENMMSGIKTAIGEPAAFTTQRHLWSSAGKTAILNGIHSGKDIVNNLSVANNVLFKVVKARHMFLKNIRKKSFVSQSAKAFTAAAAIESVLLAKDIYHLKKLQDDGKISRRDFKKGIITKTSGSIGSFSGCAVGTVIGQTLIPLPFVGGFVGGVIGSLLVKEVSSTVTGFAFDKL